MANMHDPTYTQREDDPARFEFVDGDMLAPRLVPERPLMNIYEVDAGEITYPEFHEDGWIAYGYAQSRIAVAAPTRGKARALFLDYWEDCSLSWTDITHTRLLHKAVECAEGVDAAGDWLCQHDPRCVDFAAAQTAV